MYFCNLAHKKQHLSEYCTMKNLIVAALVIPIGCAAQVSTQKKINTVNKLTSVTVYTTAGKSELRITQNKAILKILHSHWNNSNLCIHWPFAYFSVIYRYRSCLHYHLLKTFAKLPAAQQQELLTAYFDTEKDYILSFATPYWSCDFSSGSYTYVQDNDTRIKKHSVLHMMSSSRPNDQKSYCRCRRTSYHLCKPVDAASLDEDNNDLLHGGS